MYDDILFPTDGSAGAEAARDHAFELAADQDAVLHVLHVVGVLSPAASLHDTIAERMVERGWTLVETLASEGRDGDVSVRTAVREGDPAEGIVSYASAEGIDVIVMPTHGRAGLAKSLLGSVTDKVIRRGDVPVLLVKYDS